MYVYFTNIHEFITVHNFGTATSGRPQTSMRLVVMDDSYVWMQEDGQGYADDFIVTVENKHEKQTI